MSWPANKNQAFQNAMLQDVLAVSVYLSHFLLNSFNLGNLNGTYQRAMNLLVSCIERNILILNTFAPKRREKLYIVRDFKFLKPLRERPTVKVYF